MRTTRLFNIDVSLISYGSCEKLLIDATNDVVLFRDDSTMYSLCLSIELPFSFELYVIYFWSSELSLYRVKKYFINRIHLLEFPDSSFGEGIGNDTFPT